MSLQTLDSLGDLAGKKVIVRSDLNVPLSGGRITDDGRIRASVPTWRALLDRGAALIVIAHLGRPKGSVVPELSLRPVAERAGELLERPVRFVAETVGDAAATAASTLAAGEVLMLENLRFDSRETAKDDDDRAPFAAALASYADAYVSDGFGVVHRRQASVYDLPKLLPHAAGLLIEHELGALDRLLHDPKRPYTVVLGGSKVSDKLGVIDHLLPRVDSLLIGGGMAFTFLAAQGNAIGASLFEADQVERARDYLRVAEDRGVRLLLPTDVVVAGAFSADAPTQAVEVAEIESTPLGAKAMGLDIGPETASAFAAVIEDSATVFWNGPMGVFEFDSCAEGTERVARALSDSGAYTVVGGGDSAAAARSFGFSEDDFGHISTGGGASLELLEGKALPGLEVLGWQ